MDSVGSTEWLVPVESLEFLQVNDAVDGPMGIWNNKEGTEKVRKGDFVMKIRTASSSEAEWVGGDAKKMLDALAKEGPFEVEIKRNVPKPQEEIPQAKEVGTICGPSGD